MLTQPVAQDGEDPEYGLSKPITVDLNLVMKMFQYQAVRPALFSPALQIFISPAQLQVTIQSATCTAPVHHAWLGRLYDVCKVNQPCLHETGILHF